MLADDAVKMNLKGRVAKALVSHVRISRVGLASSNAGDDRVFGPASKQLSHHSWRNTKCSMHPREGCTSAWSIYGHKNNYHCTSYYRKHPLLMRNTHDLPMGAGDDFGCNVVSSIMIWAVCNKAQITPVR